MHVQAIMDWQRDARTGLAEAVYAAGKSTACLAEIVTRAAIDGHRLLLTRLSPETYTELSQAITEALDYDPQSRTAILGALAVDAPRSVAVVCGGMSDLPVAEEVRRTLLFAGVGTEIFADVGVAGLWRLMQRLEEIREFPVVVAVAGMEGAMFSVLTGLVSAPIVAVPTSVGYGVSGNGQLALNSALGSCAPGLVAVNVDNGFGAAQAALRILNLVRARGP
jgi:NCAIR mutase (PurE)-related protein